ncbi:MAG: hypothetical protein OEM02_08860 [Desulfobulbaceae bacterium]|nr:hypothetical protein [Desulfobulbaceae bacterium]
MPGKPSFCDGNPSKEELPVETGTETPQRKGEERKEEERPKDSPSPPSPVSPKSPPRWPQQEIVDLYLETLPELPGIVDWSEARQKMLRARWKEKPKRQNLDWWRRYFTEIVSQSDFLMGRSKGFQADLEWIIRPKNMLKILEGKYRNREPTDQGDSKALVGLQNKGNTIRATTVAQGVTIQNDELAKNLRKARTRRRGQVKWTQDLPEDIHANHVKANNAAMRKRNSTYRRRTNTYSKTTSGLQRASDIHLLIHIFTRKH